MAIRISRTDEEKVEDLFGIEIERQARSDYAAYFLWLIAGYILGAATVLLLIQRV